MPDRIDFAELERRVREDEDRELAAFLKGTGEAPVIYRSNPEAVRAVQDADAPIEFVCSEESDDRAGDLVRVGGWDLSAFKKNPILAWSHDYRMAPIGRWSKVRAEGKQLLGIATFDRNDPFAAQIELKYRSRFLNAVSVGFRPLEFKEREQAKDASPNPFRRAYEFIRQELLEISAVSVPMHPKALRKGLALAEDAPVWIFMPGDEPGQFRLVQPVAVTPAADLIPKDVAEARQMLDDAIAMHRAHMNDKDSATPDRMREQMRLMRGARRQMNGQAGYPNNTTTTTATTVVDLHLTTPDQGAASASTKDAPPDDGGKGKRRMAALVAELKRVREGD